MLTQNDRINEVLSILGYSEGEKVFIRKIHCNSKNDKSKFVQKEVFTYPIDTQITQDEGYGIYFVVNGQGNSKKDISHAKALFCEFDNLSIDEQFRVITRTEGLPVPTFYVKSGGKSLHFYWVFDEPVPIAKWQDLIKDLIDWVGSDTSVKDPSRLMRLPEFYHYSATESGIKRNDKSEFNLLSGERYSYQILRDSIPRSYPKDVKETFNKPITDNQIIDFLYEKIKPHQKGTNTYQNYRELFGAIKNLYGEDLAFKFGLESSLSDGYDWVQIIQSTNGSFNLGTIYYQLIELGFITKQDWIKLFKPTKEKSNKSTVTNEVENQDKVNEAWLNIATEDLFNGYWISLNNVLYKFNGQYYEEKETVIIKRMITNWCAEYVDEKGNKSKATPNCVDNVFKWVNALFGVSPNQVNCEGIPLKNGYLSLTINKETNKPNFELKPYHHNVYFTYQSEVKYDPKASSESAIKLLECLDDPYKSLFIKSVSTVLGFKEIRKKWDRIKALLLIGDGSNGKDTLREVISLILGEQGITSCSLNDFSQSRGFNIARLATNPKLNWSSENKEINIDQIQALKQAITGDPLYLEGKGKDGFEVKLNTLFIFNSNHQPDLKGNQFAIQSRLTLIPFTKTYSMTPKRGELKADPRFKHDKDFLVNDVAVGFLNLLINAFGDVYSKGIDYQESEQYFNEVIEENNHLRRFAKEIGLTYTGDESDRLTIGDIYSHLLEYYFEHGYLEIEETSNGKKKNIWLDDDKRDPVIKNGNKLKPRILELFPKAKEKTIQRKIYLCGLKIDLTHVDSPINAETTDNKGVDAPHVDSHSDSHSDSFYTHSQTHIDSPPPKNDSLFNQKSGCEQSHKNKPENNQGESTGESKVSQEVSQKVSQQKAENPNKNNGFKNQGESTAKNNVSQKNENSFDEELKNDLWGSPSEDDKSDNSEILKEKFMVANGIMNDEELLTAINIYSQTKFNSVSDIPNHVYLDLLGGYQEQST